MRDWRIAWFVSRARSYSRLSIRFQCAAADGAPDPGRPALCRMLTTARSGTRTIRRLAWIGTVTIAVGHASVIISGPQIAQAAAQPDGMVTELSFSEAPRTLLKSGGFAGEVNWKEHSPVGPQGEPKATPRSTLSQFPSPHKDRGRFPGIF